MERHDLDLTSLIAGLLFLALGGIFLMDLTGSIELHVRWVWPALLMGLGVALLASGPSRRNGAEPVPSPSGRAGDAAGAPPATTGLRTGPAEPAGPADADTLETEPTRARTSEHETDAAPARPPTDA